MAPSTTPVKMRPLTLAEQQPYLLAYGACISLVSPYASAYQLMRLYSGTVPTVRLLSASAMIFPHQTVLKWSQMNASTQVKDNLNPWVAFACIGVLQGGVYGQANIHFANTFNMGNKPTMRSAFRGVLFAGCRDMISQGVPFMFAPTLNSYLFTPLLEPLFPGQDGMAGSVKHWAAVLASSVGATYMSQGLHNCQIKMQTEPAYTYKNTIQTVWKVHGPRMFWKGAEARVGLLLVVNVLNQLLLAPVWKGTPILEDQDLKADNGDGHLAWSASQLIRAQRLFSKSPGNQVLLSE